MRVTEEQKGLVKSTASVMKDHAKEITTKLYVRLFEEHPEFRNFFNQTNQNIGKQSAALALAVFYFAENIDNLEVMKGQMAHICSKHRSILVKREHYPIVGKYLLQALKDFLGDKATPELMAAWQVVYDLIAATFVKE